ncbi:MAG: hypothetical protein J6Q84_07490 [Kiritimatiellae bacterium]|nr:hypothetical protein [Kiritimatiellia bacterium]
MKQWTVTYREKSGLKTSVVIEAEDRAGVFAELKQRGINAISITEGAVKAKRNAARSSSREGVSVSRSVWGIIATAVVVAIGVVVWLAISKDDTQIVTVEKREKKKKDKDPAPIEKVLPVEEQKDPRQIEIEKKRARLREELAKMTPEEKRDFAMQVIKDRELDLTPTTNKPFRTTTELHLARIFTTEVGERPPPPIPKIPISDIAHLEQILTTGNPIIEGDSEKIQEGKQMVELAKAELREYIKEGGDPESFIDFYYSKLVSAYQERQSYFKEVIKVGAEEPEIVGEFYRQVNESLEKKGIKKLVFPEHVKAKLGLED